MGTHQPPPIGRGTIGVSGQGEPADDEWTSRLNCMSGMKSMAAPTSNALRRIRADLMELQRNPSEMYKASPLEEDVFQWHFTVRGPSGTEFAGGIYHGRILLPPEWPFKPPSILVMTPNGRFEINKKICLSLTAHHPEHWQPAWGIRTILEALVAFFPTPAEASIGALQYRPEERVALAKKSHDFECPQCGRIADILKPEPITAQLSTDKISSTNECIPATAHNNNAPLQTIHSPAVPAVEADDSIPEEGPEDIVHKEDQDQHLHNDEPLEAYHQLDQVDTTGAVSQTPVRRTPPPFAKETRLLDSLITLVSALLLAIMCRHFYPSIYNGFQFFF